MLPTTPAPTIGMKPFFNLIPYAAPPRTPPAQNEYWANRLKWVWFLWLVFVVVHDIQFCRIATGQASLLSLPLGECLRRAYGCSGWLKLVFVARCSHFLSTVEAKSIPQWQYSTYLYIASRSITDHHPSSPQQQTKNYWTLSCFATFRSCMHSLATLARY